MKILITGGSGYLARNLKLLFIQNGDEVYNPSRYEMDVSKLESIHNYLNLHNYSFDAIIHTAIKGGRVGVVDTLSDLQHNLTMFENIITISNDKIPVVIYGSGAEFDRRGSIKECSETELWNRWPLDPYGLSKNIISRRSLSNYKNISILRLFGCFNHDESPSRFIKRSILRIKGGLPIEVNQNRIMDFFYFDDVFTVTNHIIRNGGNKHINLVYKPEEKISLITIAHRIYKGMGISDYDMKLNMGEDGMEYSGNGNILDSMKLPLIGLNEGIKRTIAALL